MSFLAIYGGLLNIDKIGMYFTVHALCLLITRPLFGKLSDRFGFTKVMIPAFIAFGCAFAIISQATTLWVFLIAAVVAACGYGVCSPLLQAIAMSSVPRARSGAASSTNFTGLDLAQLVGPTLAGTIAEWLHNATGSELEGFSCMYLAVTGIVAMAALSFMLMRKIIARNIAEAHSIDLASETISLPS